MLERVAHRVDEAVPEAAVVQFRERRRHSGLELFVASAVHLRCDVLVVKLQRSAVVEDPVFDEWPHPLIGPGLLPQLPQQLVEPDVL